MFWLGDHASVVMAYICMAYRGVSQLSAVIEGKSYLICRVVLGNIYVNNKLSISIWKYKNGNETF
jgi:hypothetical protein